jgi:YHS domain-containing protein
MTKRVSAAVIIAVWFGVAAVAQQTAAKPSQKGGQMSMDDMMAGCRKHCQTTMKSMEQMERTMVDAKASNDPAKMRAALDQAQKPLADMKEHMNMCMNMMNMMQKMHGQGGMMGGAGHMGMMSGEQLRMTTSPNDLGTLCKANVNSMNAPRATYQGKTYYFCSDADKEQFEKTPQKFIKK